ncbi:elongator complex protein 2 isoform X1 [Schistocerca gregaria]|uniref:elongator complex protein 2 isoform X1 n=1 Tax=Schistocerca gregaria TaxID=7010 RepID=UPI00211E5E51|nr:elongator complex protein 2 isoform X1 [Schistocerca gregaria]
MLRRNYGNNDLYISCSCNRTPHSSDWGRNGLICFGACNAVAIYDPKYADAGKILKVLCHHKGRVNAVQWIKTGNCSPETEFVSASSDGTAVLWSADDMGGFYVSSVLEGHNSAVTFADGIYLSNTDHQICKQPLLVVTASADSSLKIWRRKKAEVAAVCSQTVNFGSGFCLCARICILPSTSDILIACATDDTKIHLFADKQYEEICISPKENETLLSHFVKVDSLIGHDDWVRSLDFAIEDSGDVLLASCSQDTFVRLWRISARECGSQLQSPVSELPSSEDIHAEEHVFEIKGHWFVWAVESVLPGHEGWVYSVRWHPVINSESKNHQPLRMLSSSLDKTMVLWAFDAQSGLWTEEVRVGELGGNSLGFYGGMFGPEGRSIMGHGYQGAFHIWHQSEEGRNEWLPRTAAGGHFGPVVDLQWEPRGQFLLTVSTDQTTRLHAPWDRDNKEITWHELARPQVHGYDMSCLAILSRYCFASGSEEKVVRTFKAPSNFVTNFQSICNVREDSTEFAEEIPQGAAVPTLGLSNKAVYEGQQVQLEERHVKDEFPESSYFIPVKLTEPPTEDNLLQNTLWPEIQKLYGHGYELYSLAARSDGKVLASACKATTAEHAAIILWQVDSWQQYQKLTFHQLTVTQLAFSPDGVYLLSVSRDRRWGLFQRTANSERYELVVGSDKKSGIHTRIIWCCAWTHDSSHFATGSRDGKVAIWNVKGESRTVPLELKGQSVTALAFAPHLPTDESAHVLAVGLDSGIIMIYEWNLSEWTKCLILGNNSAHHLTVKRVAFRPVENEESPRLQLASCGADHIVRIQLVDLN